MKVFIRAHIPPELQQKWLQHVRDFDVANPGCHFEVMVDAPDTPLAEMMKELQVEPKLTFTQIFERKQPDEDIMSINCTCLQLGLERPRYECSGHPCPSWFEYNK